MTIHGMYAEFIECAGRRLFVLLRTPAAQAGECMLVVPPFAEEMNKSRRLLSALARVVTGRNQALLCVDLSCTGDSSGDFGQARLDNWIADLSAAAAWSRERGWPVTSLLAIRFGALLAARFAHVSGQSFAQTVFWQPVTSGVRMMDQFLRLRSMASKMDGIPGESVAELRTRIAGGDTLEVAGYDISPGLLSDMDGLELAREIGPGIARLKWFDVAGDPALPASPVTRQSLEKLRTSGCQVEHRVFAGEPFWMATEYVDLPELVAAS